MRVDYSLSNSTLIANGEPIARASDPATIALFEEFVDAERPEMELGPVEVAGVERATVDQCISMEAM